ncbi:hypothetical protein OIU34_19470 [Pararhizobium sp. BT-229]|uniref:hypothetical protein n=1 Tax=Pararhizobium sp. BT-229 TaxID=2986923 RepID=UPI0021F71E0C|nr:hypothetical protein [Pararhizobium sp. BT-229]MCV9964064.1 hypothetical protein [Pararhizobium sp. BT-229]
MQPTVYAAGINMRQKEGPDSPSLLALQYKKHKATSGMLDAEPLGTIEEYTADHAAKRAMIASLAKERQKTETLREKN